MFNNNNQSRMADNVRAFQSLRGPDLLDRTSPFLKWRENRGAAGEWSYNRSVLSRTDTHVTVREDDGRHYTGVNFASQDYLGLSSHPAIHDSVRRALKDFGPHSAGSDALMGSTSLTAELRSALGEMLRADHVVLFPTGWAGGYGIIRALVHEGDRIVLDELAHACLAAGAEASGAKVHAFCHNDCESLAEQLRLIRRDDARCGILVVTESVFSMDSDGPDLSAMRILTSAYGATLMVDVAHDLGALGPGGTGRLGQAGMLGKTDLVFGTFSKTFCSNGGFLATNHRAASTYVRCFAGSSTFSNALGNLQAAAAIEAIRIVRSAEGEGLRRKLHRAVIVARRAFEENGFSVPGEVPSAIVPVMLGDERRGRQICRDAARRGVITNFVEFPAVPVGRSRLRLQLSPAHADIDMWSYAEQVAAAKADATDLALACER